MGAFVKHVGQRRFVADPKTAAVFLAGEPYRVSHLSHEGDDCTVLTFSPAVLREAATSHGEATLPVVLACQTIPITPRVYMEVQRIRTLALNAIRPDAVEEASLGILSFIIMAAAEPPRVGASPSTARAHRDMVQAVRERLARAPADRVPLSTLATELACSPYHLARIFKAVTGITIHRYRTDLRIAMAVEYMRDPIRSLSEIAHELGFSSHSHLTSTFHRAVGRPPRAIRISAPAGRSDAGVTRT